MSALGVGLAGIKMMCGHLHASTVALVNQVCSQRCIACLPVKRTLLIRFVQAVMKYEATVGLAPPKTTAESRFVRNVLTPLLTYHSGIGLLDFETTTFLKFTQWRTSFEWFVKSRTIQRSVRIVGLRESVAGTSTVYCGCWIPSRVWNAGMNCPIMLGGGRANFSLWKRTRSNLAPAHFYNVMIERPVNVISLIDGAW